MLPVVSRTAALLAVSLLAAEAASAATVSVLEQERHVAARIIIHGQSTTQQHSNAADGEWKKVAQVVVDDRVRARAVELSTIHNGDGYTVLRSRNRVGIESILDVATTSAIAAGAPIDTFPAAAFPGGDPFAGATGLRLAGSAESWFDVSFNVDDTVGFKLAALGDDSTADAAGIDGHYRVTLESETETLFDFSSDLVSGIHGPEWLTGLLTAGNYRFRVYAAIAGENLLKIPVKVDAKLTLFDLPGSVAAVPTPAAAGIGLAMLAGFVTRRTTRA